MSGAAILVLNFNGRHLLPQCLASLSQLTTPAEIVVVDNGSSDGSVEYLRERCPVVRVLALEKNFGFAGAYNRAIAEVESEWSVLLNNDAELAPDWLEHLLAAAAAHPHAAVLGGKLLFTGLSEPGRVVQSAGASFTDAGTAFEIGWGEPDAGQYDRPALVGSIPGAALMVKRDVFLEVGGFDAGYFTYLEDVDLCWRAWLAGYQVHYIPKAVAFHHFGATNGGRAAPFRIRLMQRNRLANMVKLLEPASVPRAFVTSNLYDLYRLFEYASSGQVAGLRALAEGTAAFWRGLRPILAQRAAIQRRRKVSDQTLREKGLMVPALSAFREYRRLGRLRAARQSGISPHPNPLPKGEGEAQGTR